MANTLHIQVYKARGLLSAVAHDLRFSVVRHTLVRNGPSVELQVPVEAVKLLGKLGASGGVEPMSARDAATVENTLRTEVLQAARHPEVRFAGTIDGAWLDGRLTLRGRELPLRLPVREAGGRVSGEVELVPSKWGIAPYTALLGALRLQDRVRVSWDLDWPS